MAEFTVTRAIEIHATPERVRSLIEDFRRWTEWSPWEGLDPELKRTYTGAARGLGAAYAWEGNKKAGSGTMEIVGAGTRRSALTSASSSRSSRPAPRSSRSVPPATAPR